MVTLKKRVKGKKIFYYVSCTSSYKGQMKTFEKYIGNSETPNDVLEQKKKYYATYIQLKCKLYLQYLQIKLTELHYLDQNFTPLIVLIGNSYQDFLRSLYPTELEKYQQEFNVRYIHNTTAIEGNTLSLKETSLIIDSGISPKSKKLREIFEIENYNRILDYVRNYDKDLSLKFILEIHRLIQRNIDENTAGTLRRIEVGISGSEWKPPPAIMVKEELEELLQWYTGAKKELHTFELAGVFHHRFLQIHPFIDGNGRLARELLNFILKKNGFPPIIIPVSEREDYMKFLELADTEDEGIVSLLEFFLGIAYKDNTNALMATINQLAKQREEFEHIPSFVKVDFNELFQWYIELLKSTIEFSDTGEELDTDQLNVWDILGQLLQEKSL